MQWQGMLTNVVNNDGLAGLGVGGTCQEEKSEIAVATSKGPFSG